MIWGVRGGAQSHVTRFPIDRFSCIHDDTRESIRHEVVKGRKWEGHEMVGGAPIPHPAAGGRP